MRRRRFLKLASLSVPAVLWPIRTVMGFSGPPVRAARELHADALVIGGGLGGCAAALAALREGLRVILTEETDWIGGQLTSQAVPPDEHRWIETHGATALYCGLRSTHITNGCYRRRPVEWNIGESAGALAAWCHRTASSPRETRASQTKLRDFQRTLRSRGIELAWPA